MAPTRAPQEESIKNSQSHEANSNFPPTAVTKSDVLTEDYFTKGVQKISDAALAGAIAEQTGRERTDTMATQWVPDVIAAIDVPITPAAGSPSTLNIADLLPGKKRYRSDEKWHGLFRAENKRDKKWDTYDGSFTQSRDNVNKAAEAFPSTKGATPEFLAVPNRYTFIFVNPRSGNQQGKILTDS
ncbi:hypothetical protein M427DRAFT_28100 [Gonapodya prolifera JEL478]|uniref:Uncharacterized protein n=1 Tax=Gonapodya prolifera (strain JEL478) TaxID=1344416 RepID=A0A139AUG9_GONPJ|nr:hypothetical protein M427DRAFT_28100 [Gonapodya prolifera JEL478]|eukprot:KXS20357.1 hypothetical protein M427DRAFT_28100 [Gonapodya prolifera JEL478]